MDSSASKTPYLLDICTGSFVVCFGGRLSLGAPLLSVFFALEPGLFSSRVSDGLAADLGL